MRPLRPVIRKHLVLAVCLISAGLRVEAAPPTLLLQATTSLQHRGLSRSAGHAAASLTLDQGVGEQGYLGATVATIDLPGREEARKVLVESYLGRSVSLGDDWRLRGDIVRYDFPGALEFSYTEVALGWHYRQSISGRITYTRDALGEPEPGGSVEITGHYPISARWTLGVTGGGQFFDRDIWNDHGYWRVGFRWQRGRFAAQVAGEGTVGDVAGIQGDRGDTRLVLSVGYSR